MLAIVTGATDGIGLEISKKLINLGYDVLGFGRDINKCDFKSEKFKLYSLDFNDIDSVRKTFEKINQEEKVSILVNNAGCGYFGIAESIGVENSLEMIRVNVESAIVVTLTFLENLKNNKGNIINISSVCANQENPNCAIYGSTKAALSSFAKSIFEEGRKTGLRVSTIYPDIVDTSFYRNASFEADTNILTSLKPLDVANAVEYILKSREGMNVTEIKLEPQIFSIKEK